MDELKRKIQEAGFVRQEYPQNNTRTSMVHDFSKGDYTIILDGDNCILLELGTSIKHLPLSEANIRNMIAYVAEQTNDIQKFDANV